jgi:hypothetical protein
MPEFSSTQAALLLAYSLLYFLIAFVWRVSPFGAPRASIPSC